METFSDRLKRVMQERGLKQIDIVKRTGISKGLISLLLSEPGRDMLVSNLLQLAKVLSVDPLWLYSGKASGQYADAIINSDVHKVPVWQLSAITGGAMLDTITLQDASEYIHCDAVGKLLGVRASDDGVLSAGVSHGDICVFDLVDTAVRADDVVLAVIKEVDQVRMLKVVPGIKELMVAVDDQRVGALPISDVHVRGKMIEVRKVVRS